MSSWPRAMVLLVPLLLAWPSRARACDCGLQLDVRDALNSARVRADLIFRGQVVESRSDETRVTVLLSVRETFKGSVAAMRLVSTSAASPERFTCGSHFQKGVEYLVYASGDEVRGFSTDRCARTQPASEATAELASLRAGTLPERPVALRRLRADGSWGPVESMSGVKCAWARADTALCGWRQEPQPLPPGSPAASPGLLCAFAPEGTSVSPCRLVPDVSRPPRR